jgi:hypothetical protein
LELRRKHGRGGTEVGVARARDLSNRKTVSPSTVRRMNSYFARHEVDKQGEGWGEDSAGYIAWLLWGGDAGKSWAKKKAAELDRAEGKDESEKRGSKDRFDGANCGIGEGGFQPGNKCADGGGGGGESKSSGSGGSKKGTSEISKPKSHDVKLPKDYRKLTYPQMSDAIKAMGYEHEVHDPEKKGDQSTFILTDAEGNTKTMSTLDAMTMIYEHSNEAQARAKKAEEKRKRGGLTKREQKWRDIVSKMSKRGRKPKARRRK